MNLMTLAKDIHFCNTEKGFGSPNHENKNRKLLLVVSELVEAQEELRDGRARDYVYYQPVHAPGEVDVQDLPKPCGFPVELVDAIIRMLHIADAFQVKLTLDEWDVDVIDIDTELLSIVERVASLWHVSGHSPHFGDVLNESINKLICIANNYCDVEKLIVEKLEFNKTRPAKHGRQF